MKNSYQIVAVDLDGTLLKSDKTIHPDSICDIELATAEGLEVVYNTGRAIAEIEPFFSAVPEMRYAICYSGAIVYDCLSGKIIYHNEIRQKYVRKIVEVANKYHAMVHFLDTNASIVSKTDITHMADFNMGIYQPMYEKVATTVDSMVEEAEHHDSIPKINIYFRNFKDRDDARSELKDLPLTFANAENANLELNALGVSKALGLAQLARYLNVPLDQTVGIGDADNDREVLKTAGYSIVMKNGAEDLKESCDYVTDDNDHNGVGKAPRHILELNKQ